MMKLQCPNCLFSDDIAESKIPEKGGIAKCPKCCHRFPIKRQNDPVTSYDRFSAPTVTLETPKDAFSGQAAAAAEAAKTKPTTTADNKPKRHGEGGALDNMHGVKVQVSIKTVGIYYF